MFLAERRFSAATFAYRKASKSLLLRTGAVPNQVSSLSHKHQTGQFRFCGTGKCYKYVYWNCVSYAFAIADLCSM